MKKTVKIWISFILIAICLGGLLGCHKDEEGVIPNGVYGVYFESGSETRNTFVLYEGEQNLYNSYCWAIEGNTAQRWVSGSIEYKAKIIIENEKVYFEGYTWKDKLLLREFGSTAKYEVVYDEKSKSLTLSIISDNE